MSLLERNPEKMTSEQNPKSEDKKKILFVINTLGRAGAETALMALLRKLLSGENKGRYDISLFVLTGQGEMIDDLPEGVRVLNRDYQNESVLSAEGRKILKKKCLRALIKRCNLLRLFPYIITNAFAMRGGIKADKLLWRVLSDGAEHFDEQFDLAVAYLEGGSTYYVSDHVNASKKAAFVHVDYVQAGYTPKLDLGCYDRIDRIFSVSDEVKDAFLNMHPSYSDKTEIFHNIIDKDRIRKLALTGKGFDDGFDGIRIVTVGRLTAQKSFEVSIDAMKIIAEKGIESGQRVRWYVFGEGDQRGFLEEHIKECGLEGDFILFGAVSNPYPYISQADLYVHATRFEGKSIAIQEAQALGKAIIASDCSGNREQIDNGTDGVLCDFNAESIAEAVINLLNNPEMIKKLGKAAPDKLEDSTKEIIKLTCMI